MNGGTVLFFSTGTRSKAFFSFISAMEGFNTKLELRIDWSEMDLFGHVNNVSFFKYIQASRVNYWEKMGLVPGLSNNISTGPMLASTSCQFKKPLHYPGKVTIFARVGFIKNSSFSIQHILVDSRNDIVAEAEDVVVYFNFTENEKARLPDFLRDKIKLIEQKEF